MPTILDTVGNTPMVELQRLNTNPRIKIFAKLEGNNPGGSVKDRPALNMIRSALERGDINKSTKLVEATSGNTGIAMALMAKLFGIEIELVMPSSSTRERVLTMEAFGAKVTLLESIEACRDYAQQKSQSGEFYQLNQFANPDNQHLQLNIASPKNASGQLPAVICIHGGGFRAGKRESYDKLCLTLAEHGYVAATITYRLKVSVLEEALLAFAETVGVGLPAAPRTRHATGKTR